MTMNNKLLLLTLIAFSTLLVVQAQSRAEANSPPITHTSSGLRYGGEVFWPFTEDNLWDPDMWQEDLLPLFQQQHLSFGIWGGLDWCAIQEVDGVPLVVSDTISLEAADALGFASGIFNADFAHQSCRENLSPKARLYVFDEDNGVSGEAECGGSDRRLSSS